MLDGQTGDVVAHVDDGTGGQGTYGFQNAALVTGDADGEIGITVAGYFGVHGGNYVQGIVQHFEVSGSNGALADEGGAWPQFHHDAGLSGFVGGGAASGQCARPTAAQNGYLTVASDGGIFAFGQDFCGSTGSMTLNKPVVGMAAAPGQGGYWLVASDGGVFAYGQAGFYGSTGSLTLNAPVVGMAPTPDGKGYWLVASDGGIFSYGDAGFYGSAAAVPGQDIVGMAASPDGARLLGGQHDRARLLLRRRRRGGRHQRDAPQRADGRHGRGPGDGWLLAHRRGRRGLLVQRARSTARPAASTSTSRWSPCSPPSTAAATGSSPRTAASSPTATRPSTAPWAGSTSTSPWWAWTGSEPQRTAGPAAGATTTPRVTPHAEAT